MGKHSRCVIGVCDNELRCPGLDKKHGNEDGQAGNTISVTDNPRKFSYVCNGIPAWVFD